MTLTHWSCWFTCCLYAALLLPGSGVVFVHLFVSCRVQCNEKEIRNAPDLLFSAPVCLFLLPNTLQLRVCVTDEVRLAELKVCRRCGEVRLHLPCGRLEYKYNYPSVHSAARRVFLPCVCVTPSLQCWWKGARSHTHTHRINTHQQRMLRLTRYLLLYSSATVIAL